MNAASPDDLRADGWTVAVHNDYRQDGKQRTFWLLTRGRTCIKGEGDNDAQALNEIRIVLAMAASPADASAEGETGGARKAAEEIAREIEVASPGTHFPNNETALDFLAAIIERHCPSSDQSAARIAELEALLKPFADLGGPHDGIAPAFHDLPDDAVIYGNSGKCFTAGDVRAARIALGELIDLKGYRGGPWGEEIPPSEAALIERVAREFAGHMVWMGRHGASGKESAAEIVEREWKNYTQTAKGIIEEVRRLLTSPAGREP